LSLWVVYMIYLILTSKDDDSQYELVIINKNEKFQIKEFEKTNNLSDFYLTEKTNNTNANELPTNYSTTNNVEINKKKEIKNIDNDLELMEEKAALLSNPIEMQQTEKNIFENFNRQKDKEFKNIKENVCNISSQDSYLYTKQDTNKSHSNCECYNGKYLNIDDYKTNEKVLDLEKNNSCPLKYNVNIDSDEKKGLISKKFDLEKFNRYKHIYIKNLIIKFNSNQSLITLFVKGLLKATSKPWEIMLDLFTPKSNEGPFLIIKFIIPLFFIWNFSEIELFILEKVMSRLKVPASFLGLTIMSWGNNAPDMYNVASAMAKGLVDLALNAAIASEIHNILLGLGLPWLVYNLTYGNPIEFQMNDLYALTILFFCVFLLIFLISLKINHKKFDYKLAVFLIAIYLVFLVLLFVISFNIKIW